MANKPKHLVRIIDDGDVERALERARRGHANATDAEILSDYIAGLKAIILKLQAGSDDLLDFEAGVHAQSVSNKNGKAHHKNNT